MSPTMPPQEWLTFLQQEYLGSFIPAGGASVKVAVPLDEAARAEIDEGLPQLAKRSGYLVLNVDAAVTGVHMIDHVFHRLAEQVPWAQLCRKRLSRLASAAAFQVPAFDDRRPFAEALAEANDMDTAFMLQQARPWIQNSVFKNADLARDFRIAMANLMLAELNGGPEGATITEVTLNWLTGANKAISAVKPYGIRTRINRANARHFLESLFFWVRECGLSGTVVLLDVRRLSLARHPLDGLKYYTKGSLLDAYEVLRQFIDSTDRLTGCLIVVVPDTDFLDADSPRGMAVYEALMFRVYDEVRDRDLANPMASLIRLENAS